MERGMDLENETPPQSSQGWIECWRLEEAGIDGQTDQQRALRGPGAGRWGRARGKGPTSVASNLPWS